MASDRRSRFSVGRFVLVLLFCFLLIIGGFLWAKESYERVRYPLEYEDLILRYSDAYDLDPAFVAAVINTESSFQPDARSSANAIGLMQLQPETFDWVKYKIGEERSLTEEDLLDPEINVQYGCALYRLLLDEFGSLETAVAAYHAGWGNVKSWLSDTGYSSDGIHLDQIPFVDTAHYLERIISDQEVYARRYESLKKNTASGEQILNEDA